MSRKSSLLISALAAGLMASIGWSSLASAQSGTTTVTMAAQNNSGIAGTAVLTDLGGGRTRVVVNVTDPTGAVAKVGHIHDGTCATLGGVRYPLTTLMNGQSTTEVAASLADLRAGVFAVNFHRGATPETTPAPYTSCGNIVVAGAQTTPTQLPRTGDLGDIVPMLAAAGAGLAGLGYTLRRRAR
ncbi:MAG: LPXTG cell wall anchor domain-containing protein [Chloroflexi bacterium]|nr:LPXTG cell wall anchor domain-containing protein [Chloroflexota bacterium]